MEEIQNFSSSQQLDEIIDLLTEAQRQNKPELVLGLEGDYTDEQFHKAKRSMILKLHPDKNKGCEELADWLFKVIFPIIKSLEPVEAQ